MSKKFAKTLVLFDVDGTLTASRLKIKPGMKTLLADLRKVVDIGFVGGSDFAKQLEQLGDDCLDMFEYCFSQNGLVSWKAGKPLHENSMLKLIGEDKLQPMISFCLKYMGGLELPAKRGTFVEWRKGMINVSPVGRACSQAEREEFEKFDNENKVREKMIAAIKKEFPDLPITYSIGGQISFDVFPNGWDKRYCLKFVEKDYDTIHFFGDKTYKGGNDYEIYEDDRTKGHAVKMPADTAKLIKELFGVEMKVDESKSGEA